jgi:cobalt-zinc-cadmium efflux system outer membrane protein
MCLRTLVAGLLAALVCLSRLPAQDGATAAPVRTAGLTLAEAQRIAWEHNADLLIAETQVDAALGQLRAAREFPNPILGLSVAKVNTDQRGNATGLGNGLLDRSYDSIVSLGQLIELGKRGPRRESAQAARRSAEALRDDERRLLIKSVSEAYLAALEAREEMNVLAASAASLRREADLAATRLRAGDIAETDKAQIEMTATQRELDAETARHTALIAVLAVETLLGQENPHGATQLTDTLVALSANPPILDAEMAVGTRPDLNAAEATLEKAEADLRLQRHGPLPDLTVSAEFEHNPPDAPSSAGIGVSFPLPIWNQNNGSIRAARAGRDQAKFQLEKTRSAISAELAAARSAYREAARRNDIYKRELSSKSNKVVQAIRYAYEHGGASLVELLTAERDDNEIRIAAAHAEADTATTAFALWAALNPTREPAAPPASHP